MAKKRIRKRVALSIFDDSAPRGLAAPISDLLAADLALGVGNTKTAIGAVEAAAAKISALPAPGQNDALAPHIEAARAHSQFWTDTTRPQLLSLLAGVASLGKTFNDDYTRLTALAAKALAGDPSTKSALDALLTGWQAATGGEAVKTATALQSISKLDGDLQGDARTLGADQTAALAVFVVMANKRLRVELRGDECVFAFLISETCASHKDRNVDDQFVPAT